jgi:hypothetical protein
MTTSFSAASTSMIGSQARKSRRRHTTMNKCMACADSYKFTMRALALIDN